MHIASILKSNRPSFSFEFFPPKTPEGFETLFNHIQELEKLNPTFVSVTYGAGGSTRELTLDLLVKIKKETTLNVVSHLTTVGHNKSEIEKILTKYQESGIDNILALRGDPPAGVDIPPKVENGFPHAVDLVNFIKEKQPSLGIGVAGFPEGHQHTPNRLKEMDYLKEKVDAGADYICTQLFFDNHDFYDFN